MATYVYVTATGALYSYCPDDTSPVADAATLQAKGLAAVSGLATLDASHEWSPSQKTVVAVTPAPTPQPIATAVWILRFTPQEFQAINASTDAQVQQWLYALNHTSEIDLSDPTISEGVSYLVSLNLLASARASSIMVAP